MDKKAYYPELDIARGIGILLVVIGHTITQYATDVTGLWHFFYNFLYSFHMPLFFFVSGLLMSKSIAQNALDKRNAIRKRFNRLMVPYFFIGFAFIPINYLLSNAKRYSYSINDIFTILIGNNPEGELWFLYVLFIYSTIAIVFFNKYNIVFITLASLIVSMTAPYMKLALESIGLGFSLYQLFPFTLGIVVGLYQKEKYKITSPISIIIVAILVLFTTVYYAIGMPGYLKMALTVLMIIIVLDISKGIGECEGMIKRVFSELGKYSMDIYIMHHTVLVCLRMLFGDSGRFRVSRIVFVLVGTLVSTVLPIIISKYIIRKNQFLSFHILGIEKV